MGLTNPIRAVHLNRPNSAQSDVYKTEAWVLLLCASQGKTNKKSIEKAGDRINRTLKYDGVAPI